MRWNKVSDKMPEKEGLYLVLEIYDKKMEALFNESKYIPDSDEVAGLLFNGAYFEATFNGVNYPIETVTHWMLFPEGVV